METEEEEEAPDSMHRALTVNARVQTLLNKMHFFNQSI